MTHRPHEWTDARWRAKQDWHERERARSTRDNVAILIALQQRQLATNRGKVALGLPPCRRIWNTRP